MFRQNAMPSYVAYNLVVRAINSTLKESNFA